MPKPKCHVCNDLSAAEMPCPYWMPLLALVATPEDA